MSFSASFTAQSVSGSNSDILFTDSSVGSDGAISSRRIYAITDVGTFLVEDGSSLEYSVWALPLATTITLDLLDKDYALKLVCQWLNSSDVVLYDYTIDAQGFTQYSENFSFGLTQMLTGNPMLINDNNFAQNKWALRDDIDSGNQAILQASDLYNAQRAYDRATALRLSSQYYFNENS
ncbi:MAG: hypothetical protein V4547_16875 [Bacteroidota bacterium]